MVLENISFNEVIHNKFKKCEFCGQELEPIGLDYLYDNISLEFIEYQRCTCDKSKMYWSKEDAKLFEEQKRKRYKDLINRFYKPKLENENFRNSNFNNFYRNSNNRFAINVAKDYICKCKEKMQTEGLIITGKSGTR